jgi:hypothetical protein
MAAVMVERDAVMAAVRSLIGDALSALEWHLTHEEDAALPLIQSVCTTGDWRAFAGEMRRDRAHPAAAYM